MQWLKPHADRLDDRLIAIAWRALAGMAPIIFSANAATVLRVRAASHARAGEHRKPHQKYFFDAQNDDLIPRTPSQEGAKP